jgi:uncharacterized protein
MIEVRASPIHGRGVFAHEAIAAGQRFHVAHLLVFSGAEQAAIDRTAVGHYVFHVADSPDGDVTGLAMSPMSFVNHHRPANAAFEVDASAQTIAFTALTTIAEGEEITIDYGDFADRLGIT